jgi:hypothetical protein
MQQQLQLQVQQKGVWTVTLTRLVPFGLSPAPSPL